MGKAKILFAVMVLTILVFGVFSIFNGSIRVEAQPLHIVDWESTGGNPSNKDSLQDTMYLVKEGDSVTFKVTTDEVSNFTWEVNKAVVFEESDLTLSSFTFNVPIRAGIWEIHVKAWNKLGEDHLEWVISTLSAEEAPVVFDYFTDGKCRNRTKTDPWGRPLPEWYDWHEKYYPNTSKLWADTDNNESTVYITTLSNVTEGTWKFRYRFPKGVETSEIPWAEIYFMDDSESDISYVYPVESTAHHHVTIRHDGESFSIDYDGVGFYHTKFWYEVTIIRKDGWLYLFKKVIVNGEDADPLYFEMHAYDKVASSKYICIRALPDGTAHFQIDCVEIYKERYFFPEKKIFLGDYVADLYCSDYDYYPINKTGIIVQGRNVTLVEIAEMLNNPSLFSYDYGTRTAVCRTNLVVDEGASLVIENETLKFDCQEDGELQFVADYGSRLTIRNSMITTTNEHYFVWNLAGSTTHWGSEILMWLWARKGSFGPGYFSGGSQRPLATAFHGEFRVYNSVIDNFGHLFLDSPYEVVITDSRLTRMHQVDIGTYIYQGSYSTALREEKEFAKGPKSFWIYIDDVNINNFLIRNVLFSGAETINVVFSTNAHRDKLNIYDVRVENGNITIKESLAQTYGQSHTCYCNGAPYDWKSYISSELGLVNCRFDRLALTPGIFRCCENKTVKKAATVKYYLDVKVIDKHGNPVPNATVLVINEVDDANYPSENMQPAKPYATEEYSCYYHHYRLLSSQPLRETFTGEDGHTSLPSENLEKTIVVADYSYRWDAGPWRTVDAVRISCSLRSPYWRLFQLQLFDNLYGEILRASRVVSSSEIREGDILHFMLNYTRDKIRLKVVSQENKTLWDTGELEIKAAIQPYNFDNLGFEVRKWDPWHVEKNITWVPDGYVRLYDDIYRGEVELQVDNSTIYVDGVGYIEDNDYTSDPGLIPIEEDGEEYYPLMEETGGKSFVWKFDSKVVAMSGDGPFFALWLRDSRSEMPANPFKIEYSYTIIASKDGKNATFSGLNLDESWLREDPDTPLKTVVINIDTGEAYIEGKITGSVTGVVLDDLGNPVEGATITLNGYEAVTNSTGGYVLNNVPIGNYTVSASKLGYYSQSKSIQVLENQTVIVNFTLSKDRVAPTIEAVYRASATVRPDQTVTVFANVTDEGTSVMAVILSYKVAGEDIWHNVTMENSAGNTYVGEIPGFSAGTLVYYKVIAYDYSGNVAVEDNAGSYYTYAVVSEFPSEWVLFLTLTAVVIIAAFKFRKKFQKEAIR